MKVRRLFRRLQNNIEMPLHKQKPTCTTWGKPPQSAIWEKNDRLINKSFVQPYKNEYFIHLFNTCKTKSFTFNSVVLVGFNLELHSTWNIRVVNIEPSNCKHFSKLFGVLKWWSVTHHGLHSRWCVANYQQCRAPGWKEKKKMRW